MSAFLREYFNDLLILAGFVVSSVAMWQLAPWLLGVWVGLTLILVGLYRLRGDV